jgi:hypothetical protein
MIDGREEGNGYQLGDDKHKTHAKGKQEKTAEV